MPKPNKMGYCCEMDCPLKSDIICQKCGHNVCYIDANLVSGKQICGHCVPKVVQEAQVYREKKQAAGAETNRVDDLTEVVKPDKIGYCCEMDCSLKSEIICQKCGHNVCYIDANLVSGKQICGHCVPKVVHEAQVHREKEQADGTETNRIDDLTDVVNCLKSQFGHEQFRNSVQQDATMTLVEGNHDIIVTMPTGSGKSLIYQLPAVLLEGKVTVVISPLIALIKDQLDSLRNKNISAATLNSKMSKAEKETVKADLCTPSPQTRLLYVTPEQVATEKFKKIYKIMVENLTLKALIVDEAHCLAEQDFRPEYRNIGKLREVSGNLPVVALTATASEMVKADIIKTLNLRTDHKAFSLPCFRSNIFYDIAFKHPSQVSMLKISMHCLILNLGKSEL